MNFKQAAGTFSIVSWSTGDASPLDLCIMTLTPGIGNELHTKKKSIKMMIFVVIVFAITWLPYQVFCTLKVLWIDFNK